MKAVHFGAGNIGRGFVGLLLHEGGYELVFSDVSAPLVEAINAVSEYTVHEVGDGGTDKVVTGFRAIDSSADAQAVIDEVSTADVVTTAVGPTILRFVAPHIIAGLALRDPSAPPLQIMACENGINATDLLRDEMREQAGDGWDAVSARAVFANTAADRIVPAQPPGEGVDVTVEPFYEWAIERHPFGDTPPHIPGALAEPAIAAKVSATLEETSALLEAVHGWMPRSSPTTARRSCAVSRTPRSPTRSSGWAASRCASCRGTNASSLPPRPPPNGGCRPRPWLPRWAPLSSSTCRRTSSRWRCSDACATGRPPRSRRR